MTRWFRRLSVLASVAAFVGLAADLSCKTFDTPNETCSPGRQVQTSVQGHEDQGCTRCLEDNCCDKVGVCQNKAGCAEAVSNAYDCVLQAGLSGAREERGCVDDAGVSTLPEADDSYRCMRDQCGQQCGLPVCHVDPAVVEFRNPECDGCFASSCCTQLNACYGNRACKLSIECIVRECGPVLGQALIDNAPLLAAGGASPPDDAAADIALCADGAPPAFGVPQCVLACLCKYQLNDPGLPSAEAKFRPFRLAQSVYACGAKAGCGTPCIHDGGPH